MANRKFILLSVLSFICFVAFAQEFQLQQQLQPQVAREINNNDGLGNYLFT